MILPKYTAFFAADRMRLLNYYYYYPIVFEPNELSVFARFSVQDGKRDEFTTFLTMCDFVFAQNLDFLVAKRPFAGRIPNAMCSSR